MDKNLMIDFFKDAKAEYFAGEDFIIFKGLTKEERKKLIFFYEEMKENHSNNQ